MGGLDMAFPLRLDEKQDATLNSFLASSGHATKSKAIIWLIENAERLIESDKKLNDITDAYERKQMAEELISSLLTR